jgi:hypothetical protein
METSQMIAENLWWMVPLLLMLVCYWLMSRTGWRCGAGQDRGFCCCGPQSNDRSHGEPVQGKGGPR